MTIITEAGDLIARILKTQALWCERLRYNYT
jgi:hypothetical protein